MAGLFEKDFRLLSQRKSTFFIFIIVAVVMGISVGGEFIIAYGLVMALTLCTSTISYDEYDNGFPFIMSLPVTKKLYVAEKYLLSAVVMIITTVVTAGLSIVMSVLKKEMPGVSETVFSAFLIMFMMYIMAGVMIPALLKFGAEKSRVVLIVIIGICFAAFYVGKQPLESMNVDFSTIANTMNGVSPVVVLLIMFLISAAVTGISVAASNYIMAKKEF